MNSVGDFVREVLSKSYAKLIIRQTLDALMAEENKRQKFYSSLDEDSNLEFVNGEVFSLPPVAKMHLDAAKNLYLLLSTYVDERELGFVGFARIMIALSRNDYQPDLCFFNEVIAAKFQSDQWLFPTPDFVVEVLSNETQKMIDHDKETKYKDYEQHGVSEYWIIDPEEKTVEQYLLKNGKYELHLKASEGHIHSQAVPGFSIPIEAIFSEDANLNELRQILIRK